MKKIKEIKIVNQDESTEIANIGADAINVDYNDTTVKDELDKLNTSSINTENVLNKKPYYYNNVADMKADTKLKVGDMAVTLGYYEPNDGGGAEYNILSGSYTDDGGSYHELDNNLFAKLIIKNNKINVKCFGAYGDNEHDDTNAIKKIINIITENEILFFPQGFYLITNTLTISKKITLKCDGKIISSHCTPLFLIENIDDVELDINNIEEKNVIYPLDVLEDKYNINAAIVIRNSKWNKILINKISKFHVGCLLYSSGDTHYNTISIKNIDTCFYGFEIISHNGGSANANLFFDSVFNYHSYNSEENGYFIKMKSYGDTPYKNNSNIFKGLMAEYGVSVEGGPKLLFLENTHSNYFEFDRIEIASTSSSDPFTINTDNATNNKIIINYMSNNFKFNNDNTFNNHVYISSGYGSSNLSNEVKWITSDLVLSEGVSIYTGGVFVDYLNRICYINIALRNISTINQGNDILYGLPTPREHVRIYTPTTSGNDVEGTPQTIANLLISKSISNGHLRAQNNLLYGSTTPINISYRF